MTNSFKSFSDLYFYDLHSYSTTYLGQDLSGKLLPVHGEYHENVHISFLDTSGNLIHEERLMSLSPGSAYTFNPISYQDNIPSKGSFCVFQYGDSRLLPDRLHYRERGYLHVKHKVSGVDSIHHGNIGNIYKYSDSSVLFPSEQIKSSASSFSPERSWPSTSNKCILRFHNTCSSDSNVIVQTFDSSGCLVSQQMSLISSLGTLELFLFKPPEDIYTFQFSSCIPLCRPIIEFFTDSVSWGPFHA